MPKLERIHLHTNGLLWTQRIWEKIPAETRALIRSATISIDAATPATYAENRRGGDFPTLLGRLSFIAELRTEGPLDYLEIHIVQANNHREIRVGRARSLPTAPGSPTSSIGAVRSRACAGAIQRPRILHPAFPCWPTTAEHPHVYLELDRPENGRARAAAGGGDHSR
jgi:hypothetical protein